MTPVSEEQTQSTKLAVEAAQLEFRVETRSILGLSVSRPSSWPAYPRRSHRRGSDRRQTTVDALCCSAVSESDESLPIAKAEATKPVGILLRA